MNDLGSDGSGDKAEFADRKQAPARAQAVLETLHRRPRTETDEHLFLRRVVNGIANSTLEFGPLCEDDDSAADRYDLASESILRHMNVGHRPRNRARSGASV